jgi:multidrug efflux pump subunit AcrA (membrane-fusion protein)
VSAGDLRQVVSGVAAGDRVVVSGPEQLEDGQRVQIKPAG